MKRVSWVGWLLAGLMLFQNIGTGLASSGDNPLDGHLLQHSGGAYYLYHNGVKFAVQIADVGDQVIDVIPNAAPGQFELLFRDGPQFKPLVPNLNPQPYQGYS